MPRERVTTLTLTKQRKPLVYKQYITNPEPKKRAARKQYSANPEPKKRAARMLYSANPEPKKRAARKLYSANPEPKKRAARKQYVTVHAKTFRKSANIFFEIRADFASPIFSLPILQISCG